MKQIKIRYILKHKGKIKVVFATMEEIEQGKMDEYLMQKSEKFRSEDKVIARNLFTSFLDELDKEIYEEDIVECFQQGETKIGKVIFIDGLFGWEYEKDKYSWGYKAFKKWEGEVIGNIHQGLLPKYKHLENKFKELKKSYGK